MNKFVHGERVFVKCGFYKFLHGAVSRKGLVRYFLQFDCGGGQWFWPWQIGRTFTIRPADNKGTMENVRRAQEIIARAQAAAEIDEALEASEK